MPPLPRIGVTVRESNALGLKQLHWVVCATVAEREARRHLPLHVKDAVRVRNRPGCKTGADRASVRANRGRYIP